MSSALQLEPGKQVLDRSVTLARALLQSHAIDHVHATVRIADDAFLLQRAGHHSDGLSVCIEPQAHLALSGPAFDYSTFGRLCHGLARAHGGAFDAAGQTGAGSRPAATSMCTTHP